MSTDESKKTNITNDDDKMTSKKTKKLKSDEGQTEKKKRMMFGKSRALSSRNVASKKLVSEKTTKDDLLLEPIILDKLSTTDKSVTPEKSKKLKKATSTANLKSKIHKVDKSEDIKKVKKSPKIESHSNAPSHENNKHTIPLPIISLGDDVEDLSDEEDCSVEFTNPGRILHSLPISPNGRNVENTIISPRSKFVVVSPRDDIVSSGSLEVPEITIQNELEIKIDRVQSLGSLEGGLDSKDIGKSRGLYGSDTNLTSPGKIPSPRVMSTGPPPPPPLPGQSVILTMNSKMDGHTYDEEKFVRTRTPCMGEETVFTNWDHRSYDFESKLFELRKDLKEPDDMFLFPENDVVIELLESEFKYPELPSSTPFTIKECYQLLTSDKLIVRVQSEWYGGKISHKDRVREYEMIAMTKNNKVTFKADIKKSTVKPIKKKIRKSSTSEGKLDRSSDKESESIDKTEESETEISEHSETESTSETSSEVTEPGRRDSKSKPISRKLSRGERSPSSNRKRLDSQPFSGLLERSRSLSISMHDGYTPFHLKESFLSYDDKKRKREYEKREKERKDIFDIFSPTTISSEPTDDVHDVQLSSTRPGVQVLFNFKNIKITAGYEEPFWFSGTFYDMSKKCRLSETFYFDFNHENELLRTLIIQHYGESDQLTSGRRFMPHFSYCDENIYLIIRVSTVIRSCDIEQLTEPHHPGHNMGTKEKQKWLDSSRQATSLLGMYRQSFGWAALQLFDDTGKLKLTEETLVGISKMKQQLTDEVLYDMFDKSDEIKKQKPMAFQLNLSAGVYSAEKYSIPEKVDSMLITHPNMQEVERNLEVDKASTILKNLVKPPQEIKGVVRELDNFYVHSLKDRPISHIVNNLYIYPQQINLQAAKSIKAKRVVCKIHLVKASTSETLENSVLEALYGRSSEPKMITSSTTTIWVGTHSPNIWDEIKIQLPYEISEDHHLLFAFYNVNTKVLSNKVSKQGDDVVQHLVGYSWVPIYHNKSVLMDGEHIVPIENASGEDKITYNPVFNLKDEDYIDKEKVLFTFKSRLISTVISQDQYLNEYFSILNRENEKTSNKDKRRLLECLRETQHSEILRFFPVILNQLVSQLCNTKSESLQQGTFQTLVWVASQVYDQTMTSGKVSVSDELLMYSKFYFRNPAKCKTYPCVALLQNWITLLELGGASKNDDPLVSLSNFSIKEISWFLFELIYKSSILKLTTLQESRSEATEPLKKNLKKLISNVNNYRQNVGSGFHFINRVIARNINRLFYILDRGFVFDLIYDHLQSSDGEQAAAGYRFTFVQIVSDFEHYIPLNLPTLTPIQSCNVIHNKFWKNHYLAGLYLNELSKSLFSPNDTKLSRVKAIPKFRDLLWKHHIDNRYENKDKRKRIASIYFPLFVAIIENYETFVQRTKNDADNTERIEWCICLIWILKYCSREVHLRPWWRNESCSNVFNLFSLLRIMIETFEKEDQLRVEIMHLMIEICDLIIDDLYRDMNNPGSKAFEALSNTILYLLRLQKSEQMNIFLLQIIRTFIIRFKKPIFRYMNSYLFCGDLTYEVFSLCQGQPKRVMVAATSILYLLLRSNSDEMNHFARMKLQSTSAMSRLVKKEQCNHIDLRNCLEAMAHYKDEIRLISWENQVRDFINRHARIIRDHSKIQSTQKEFYDIISDLIYNVSLEYTYSPDLRTTWLNNLAAHHEASGHFEEAASCKVQIAALVCDYLIHNAAKKQTVKGIPEDLTLFTRVFPNIKEEKGFSTIWLEGNTILSPDFSEDGFVKNMNAAIDYSMKADNLEIVVELYLILSHYFKENKKYEMLAQNSLNLSKVSQTLFESTQSQSRIPSNFYRVGFYGIGFDEDNGKEFIYRQPPSIRLSDFTDDLVNRYKTKFGESNFELLKNKPIEELELDPKTNYIQIVACEISFSYEEALSKDRMTYPDRCFDIKKFHFETPYIREGSKPTEEVSEIYKRKIILYPSKTFPYLVNRIPIRKKDTIILSPIESATDLLLSFVTNIKQQLNCVPPNIKNVQIILQGSILTQVNAGPLAIIREFIGNGKKYPEEDVRKLKEVVNTFMRLCQFGMRLTAKLIVTEKSLEPLHVEISKALNTLQSTMKEIEIESSMSA